MTLLLRIISMHACFNMLSFIIFFVYLMGVVGLYSLCFLLYIHIANAIIYPFCPLLSSHPFSWVGMLFKWLFDLYAAGFFLETWVLAFKDRSLYWSGDTYMQSPIWLGSLYVLFSQCLI